MAVAKQLAGGSFQICHHFMDSGKVLAASPGFDIAGAAKSQVSGAN
jgi:hypothetical protein